jgi:hypothetical protein
MRFIFCFIKSQRPNPQLQKIFPSQQVTHPLRSQTRNLRCKQIKNPQVIQEQRNVHHHVHSSHFSFVAHGELVL